MSRRYTSQDERSAEGARDGHERGPSDAPASAQPLGALFDAETEPLAVPRSDTDRGYDGAQPLAE